MSRPFGLPSPRAPLRGSGDPDVLAWQQDMTASGRSERTINERMRVVARAAEWAGCPPERMTSEDVTAFLAKSPERSRGSYYGALHAYFSWLARTGRRDDIPTMQLDRPKVGYRKPRTISTEHVRALLSVRMWPTTRAMILLGAYQGMRASEIAAVRGTDIDMVLNEIRVIGKGDKERVIDLHPLVRALAASMPRGMWFPSNKEPGRPIHGATVSHTVGEVMERAGVPGTCHDLRRWFATTMIDAGNSLTTVQELLGHASVATTQRYIQVNGAARAAAVRSLPDVTVVESVA